MSDEKIGRYKTVMAHHKESLATLEAMLNQLDVEAITEANGNLLREKEAQGIKYKALQKEYAQLKEAHDNLRIAFSEHVLAEKMTFVNASKNRVALLFGEANKRLENQLKATEDYLLESIKLYESKMVLLQEDRLKAYQVELDAIKTRLKPEVQLATEELNARLAASQSKIDEAYAAEGLLAIDPKLLDTTIQRKGIEFKWGLNVINKLGVVLILIAIVLAGQYTYKTFFGDYAKGITFYLLGASLMVAGQYFHKKKYTSLAMSLMGGGVGILYAATFISTFYLEILDIWPALMISVGIAVGSTVLSQVYKSQALGALSLVGGYLPPLAYMVVQGMDGFVVLGAIAYLLVLNGAILALSLKRGWQVVLWLGFALNLICSDALFFLLDHTLLGISLALVNFATYLFILIYRGGKQPYDTILLSLNAIGHVGVIYALMNRGGPSDYNGLMAILFGALFLAIPIWMDRVNEGAVASAKPLRFDTQLILALKLMAGVFSILVVPLQLDLEWWFFGWLLEGVFFISWGQRANFKQVVLAGWALLIVANFMFLVRNVDVLMGGHDFPSIFDWKFAATAAAFLAVTYVYRQSDKKMAPYHYFTLVYMLLFFHVEGSAILTTVDKGAGIVDILTVFLVSLGILLMGARRLGYQKWVDLDVVKLWGYVISVILITLSGLVLSLGFSSYFVGLRGLVEVLQLIGQNYIAVIGLNAILKSDHIFKASRPVRSIGVSVYILFAYYVNFLLRINTGFDDLLLNISLIVFSILYILFGFVKRDAIYRKVGLVLAFATTGKLLIIDSLALPLGQKIISYFTFGVILIGISYIYQRMNAKWSNDADGREVTTNDHREEV